jgi:hypothetical protein
MAAATVVMVVVKPNMMAHLAVAVAVLSVLRAYMKNPILRGPECSSLSGFESGVEARLCDGFIHGLVGCGTLSTTYDRYSTGVELVTWDPAPMGAISLCLNAFPA